MNIRSLLRVLPFERFRNPPPRVAVVRLEGVISASSSRLRRGQISLTALDSVLERAFEVPDVAAVALAINSPGGSAVQSSLVAGRIRALAEEKEVPVLAFVEDVAASGGYWLACAADEIYADAGSLVGSIGVIFSGFGFTELIARAGIERRVHTAGENKAMLDPFLPEASDDVKRLTDAQDAMHEVFKDWVRARRGERINGSEDELYSGTFWTGGRAVELGLVDALGDMRSVLRARFGDKVAFVPFGARRSMLSFLRGGADMSELLGGAIADRALLAIEERALWSRFGL
ncbi:MAG: S49 family peptidase [Alphaproteobacteria bacterium]|jgi:signal peptide peptidase SppA